MKAAAIKRWQSGVDHQQPLTSLYGADVLLRIELRIRILIENVTIYRVFAAPVCIQSLQPDVVRNAEQPAAQIVLRLPASKMLKQREEYILHHIFAIGVPQT